MTNVPPDQPGETPYEPLPSADKIDRHFHTKLRDLIKSIVERGENPSLITMPELHETYEMAPGDDIPGNLLSKQLYFEDQIARGVPNADLFRVWSMIIDEFLYKDFVDYAEILPRVEENPVCAHLGGHQVALLFRQLITLLSNDKLIVTAEFNDTDDENHLNP